MRILYPENNKEKKRRRKTAVNKKNPNALKGFWYFRALGPPRYLGEKDAVFRSHKALRSVGESQKYHGTHNKDREDKDNDKYME